MSSEERQEFDVGPRSEMQEKHGWYAENKPVIRLNPANVPANLRDLIPFAEEWGISCDVTRSDALDKASEEQIEKLRVHVTPRIKEIDEWLDSIPTGKMSEEAATFMWLTASADL